MPRADALLMYNNMEAIARMLFGEATFCAVNVTNPKLKKLADQHLYRANLWVNYLTEQKAKYRD